MGMCKVHISLNDDHTSYISLHTNERDTAGKGGALKQKCAKRRRISTSVGNVTVLQKPTPRLLLQNNTSCPMRTIRAQKK